MAPRHAQPHVPPTTQTGGLPPSSWKTSREGGIGTGIVTPSAPDGSSLARTYWLVFQVPNSAQHLSKRVWQRRLAPASQDRLLQLERGACRKPYCTVGEMQVMHSVFQIHRRKQKRRHHQKRAGDTARSTYTHGSMCALLHHAQTLTRPPGVCKDTILEPRQHAKQHAWESMQHGTRYTRAVHASWGTREARVHASWGAYGQIPTVQPASNAVWIYMPYCSALASAHNSTPCVCQPAAHPRSALSGTCDCCSRLTAANATLCCPLPRPPPAGVAPAAAAAPAVAPHP